MSSSDAAFEQADVNRDGYLTEGEFRNFVQRNSNVGNDFNNTAASNGYGSSGFRSSIYEASSGGGGLGGNLAYNAASSGGGGGAGFGSSYESSSYRSSVGNVNGELANLNVVGAADGTSTNFASETRSSLVQQYETDAQGNFKDPSPQVIRRPAQNGPVTYSQNIRVRFLQPPPVPPPGVSVFLIAFDGFQ
jgi:hypothetical protein